MKYDRKVSLAVHAIHIPVEGFTMEVVDFDKFVLLRFYYSQWITYTEREQIKLLGYLDNVKQTIEAFGIAAALDPVMDVKNVVL